MFVEPLTAWANRHAQVLHNAGRQGNVRGDHDVAGMHEFEDSKVGVVCAVGDRNDLYQIGAGHSYRLVGDKDKLNL